MNVQSVTLNTGMPTWKKVVIGIVVGGIIGLGAYYLYNKTTTISTIITPAPDSRTLSITPAAPAEISSETPVPSTTTSSKTPVPSTTTSSKTPVLSTTTSSKTPVPSTTTSSTTPEPASTTLTELPPNCEYSDWVDPGMTECKENSSDKKWYRTLTSTLLSGSPTSCPSTNTRQELCSPIDASCEENIENDETNYTFGTTFEKGSVYQKEPFSLLAYAGKEPFQYRHHIRDVDRNEYFRFESVYRSSPVRQREEFSLDPRLYKVSSADLDPTKWYRRGNLVDGKTLTITPSQYGGKECPSYPNPIYQYKIPEFSESALCVLTDDRVYKPESSGMSGYVLKSPEELDKVSSTGVTQRAAQYNGLKCSDRVALEPLRFPPRISSLE